MSRVLIVEDDLDVRDWIAHCMLQDGDEIRGVPDGRRLQALHTDEPDYWPDLVLMDYNLPDTNGVDLLADLRVFWPGVPAVFVTVQWTGEVIERIQSTGAERIAKPFNPEDLRAAASRALAGPGR